MAYLNPKSKSQWFEGYGELESAIQHQNKRKQFIMKKVQDHLQETTEEQLGCPYVFLHYVRPLLQVLYWLCYFPSCYKYDSKTRSHIRTQAGLIRKTVAIILQILSIANIYGNLMKLLNQTSISNNDLGIGVIYRVMFVCFMILSISFYYILWVFGDRIHRLLTRIEVLTKAFQKNQECQRQLPKSEYTRVFVWTIVVCYGIFIIIYSVWNEVYGSVWPKTFPSASEFLMTSTKQAEALYFYGTGLNKQLNLTTVEEVASYYTWQYTLSVGLAFYICAAYQNGSWVYSFLLILLWGLLFRKLFQVYFNALTKVGNGSAKLSHIRMFHKITILIEDYNHIFGKNVLMAVISCLLWSSSTVWDLFTTFTSNIASGLIQLYIFINFALTLIICSEVNQVATQMSMWLKVSYQDKISWRKMLNNENHTKSLMVIEEFSHQTIKNHNIGSELTQGLLMINHDLQSNTIGIKGYGFFTITYTFIGTVLSVIMTYSVLFHQWSPKSAIYVS